MAKSNENEPLAVSLLRGSAAANLTGVPALYMPKKSKVMSVRICDQLGIAADNTNYVVVSVKNGSAVVASYDSRAAGQGALAAGVSKAAALDPGAVDAIHVPAGSDLTVDVAVHGAAVLTNANITMEYFPL